MSISFLRQLLMKEAVKKSAGSSGIMSINKNITKEVEQLLQKYINDAMQQGVDIETLSPDQLKMIVAMNKPQPPKIYSGQAAVDQLNKLFPKKGEVVEFPQKTSFKEQIDAMRKSGDLVDEDNMVISEKITDREMFKNSNLNKPTIEGQMEKITGASNKIKQIKKEQAEMYRPKTDAEIKAKYDKLNKDSVERLKKKKRDSMPIRLMKNFEKELNEADLIAEGYSKDQANVLIKARKKMTSGEEMNPNESLLRVKEEFADKAGVDVEDFTDIDFEIDVPDFAKGGRAGFYTGGITDVEPSLDDIGHGSDSLMSRTRLMSPGSQTTTSTGLNYLLAEDNDNLRVPFSTGKLAGGIDSAIEKNKNLENMIALIEARNKRLINQGIKNAPEGVLMDPPPEKNDILSLGEEGTKLNNMRDPRTLKRPSDLQSNTIIFDDGTIYYKDTGEYYNDDGSQVPGPSKGAKIKPFVMEAAEGGRIGFAGGGDAGRRAFLKLMASIGGLTAAAKSGILGLGEGTGKKAVTETIKQSAGSGRPPPYFFKLVEKIKFMGDDAVASQDKAIAKKYKDYILEEDFAGNISIIRKGDMDAPGYEEVYMGYSVDDVPLKGKKGSTKVEEYDEYTVRPDGDGKMKDVEDGVPDDVLDDAGDPDSMTLKKADGGRIGYVGGGLSKLGITGSSRKFLEKVFGKEKFANMIENDPELHRGMLEVVEMFRSKDKTGLVEYMQNFLPQMSKKELEAFVVGSGDTAGIEGQLIRLGSGRDYKNKIEMIEESNNIRKLKDFDIDGVSKNAEGGRIEMKGGGDALKALIKYYANKKGVKGSTFLKDINPKTLPEGIENILGPEQLKALQINQTDYVQSLLNIMKSDKNFLNNLKANTEEAIAQAPIGMEAYAKEITESIKRDAMKGSRFDRFKVYDKIDIDDAIVDVEQMIKNRRIKESDGRALNASGGLQTMLGE